jgi:hypothetical protein
LDILQATVKKYMSIMTTRRHADISDFSVQKSFTTLPQNIRHAATALTGMGCSVAASFGAFLCIRHADKKRHIDRTVPHHPQHRRP